MKASVALAVAMALFAAPAAHAGDPAVEAVIHKMVEGFNSGDLDAVRATQVAAPSIMDTSAPYLWSGPGAFERWLADLTAAETAQGKSEGKVWVGEPSHEAVSGNRAYVVTPATYTFQQEGRAMRETGTFTFARVREKGRWKIAAWTWTSPKPEAVE